MITYNIIKKIKTKNYYYYKLEKNKKLYFGKQLKTDDKDLKQSLENEIRKYMILKNYEFIPKIINYDLNDNFYIIYEYIDGKSLDKIEHLTLLESLQILIEIASMLEKLHSENLAHCDVKPSNIMINNAGKIFLLDYGNCMFVGEKVTYGSKRYCSVDQLKMAPVNVQFDIYALGIIMYELITKEKPFMNMDSKNMLKAKLENNLSIKNTILDIPDFIDEIFHKSIGVANKNYHNITEMKKDLIKIANCVK